MTEGQEAHLELIKNSFCGKVDGKYRTGQEEHGGNLYEKTGLVAMAIEEAVDQYTYLTTLEQQREEMRTLLMTALNVPAAEKDAYIREAIHFLQ